MIQKQTVLFAFGENGLPLHPIANVEECMKSYKKETGYFFTSEQLNEYTANVIKQALETAAENSRLRVNDSNVSYGEHFSEKCGSWTVNKQSITNTFEETFKLFEV